MLGSLSRQSNSNPLPLSMAIMLASRMTKIFLNRPDIIVSLDIKHAFLQM